MDKVNIFKIPGAVRMKSKKPKHRVLSEEEYTAVLESIIERDFFPDLRSLRAQNNLEENSVTNQRTEVIGSGKKIHSHPIGKSPSTFETPIRTSSSNIPSETGTLELLQQHNNKMASNIAKKHTLNSFLNSHTSEDNESFQSIISNTRMNIEMKLIDLYKLKSFEGDGLLKAKNSLQAILNGVDTVRNSTMFVPDGVKLTPSEEIDKIQKQVEISHDNTRFLQKSFNENNHNATNNVLNSQEKFSKNAPIMLTPSPAPGLASTPFMTWGEIEGTPSKLDPNNTPTSISGPSFHIKESSKRELLALELAEKAGERMRRKKERAFQTKRNHFTSPYTRKTTDRLASLSPAAKRLAAGKLGLCSIMPSTFKHLSSPHTPLKITEDAFLSQNKRTPVVANVTSNESSTTLTDNLLNIPQERLKARDFF